MEVEESDLTAATFVALQSQDVNMEAASTSGTASTTNRPRLTRLRCESECEEQPEPTESAPWHANVPNGWVATLVGDIDEQKKIVSGG